MSFVLLTIAVFAGGVLTILSPCILPVLPFVFASTGQPFVRWIGPMLLGLVIAFVSVSVIGVIGTEWVAEMTDVGRWGALAVLAVTGVTLLSPRAATLLTGPVVRLGASVERRAIGGSREGPAAGYRPLIALTLGLATGLLWAPCAGPLLGIVIALAASRVAPGQSVALFAAFGLGAATALIVALAMGARLLAWFRRAGLAERLARRVLGALTIAAVVLIALGWDAELLSRGGLVQTSGAEEAILDRLVPTAKGDVARALATPFPADSSETSPGATRPETAHAGRPFTPTLPADATSGGPHAAAR